MLASKHSGLTWVLYAQHFAILVLKDNKLKTCSKQLTLSIINTVLVKKVWFHFTTPTPNPQNIP